MPASFSRKSYAYVKSCPAIRLFSIGICRAPFEQRVFDRKDAPFLTFVSTTFHFTAKRGARFLTFFELWIFAPTWGLVSVFDLSLFLKKKIIIIVSAFVWPSCDNWFFWPDPPNKKFCKIKKEPMCSQRWSNVHVGAFSFHSSLLKLERNYKNIPKCHAFCSFSSL